MSSFVRRVTYPKISPIGLHFAKKHVIKKSTTMMAMTTTTTTDATGVNYSPWQKNFAMDKNGTFM